MHQGAQEALPSPPTNNQPAAPNPAAAADGIPTIASKEDQHPLIPVDEFTFGENQFGEESFELGFSFTPGETEERVSVADKDHYAAIGPTPEETSHVVFSLPQDEDSTQLPAPPQADKETLPPGFFEHLISRFTGFVGPMGSLIVEEQVANLGEGFAAFPQSRLDELLALLSREILDDRSKALFQKQMAEKARTLASGAPAALAREKR